MAASVAAALAGAPLAGAATPRWAGLLLLAAFALAAVYLISAAKDRERMAVKEEPRGWQQTSWGATGLTPGRPGPHHHRRAAGRAWRERTHQHRRTARGVGRHVIFPAVIESEEAIRQAVPAKMGFSDIAAGSLMGTMLYSTLFNLGLIIVVTRGGPATVRTLDWPVLVRVNLLVAVLLARGASPAPTGCSRWRSGLATSPWIYGWAEPAP